MELTLIVNLIKYMYLSWIIYELSNTSFYSIPLQLYTEF